MSDIALKCKELNQWIHHTTANHDKLNKLYTSLSDHLDTILGEYASSSSVCALQEILALLLPNDDGNLFGAVCKEEGEHYMHPFPLSFLPKHTMELLTQKEFSKVHNLYKKKQYDLRDGTLFLPTRDYFYFCFIRQSMVSGRPSSAEWVSSPDFLASIYLNPFVILYTKYLIFADSETLELLVDLTEEFILLDVATGNSYSAPPRHICEMLVFFIHVLQQDPHSLQLSYNLKVFNPDSLLLTVAPTLYKYLQNLTSK